MEERQQHPGLKEQKRAEAPRLGAVPGSPGAAAAQGRPSALSPVPQGSSPAKPHDAFTPQVVFLWLTALLGHL